MTPLVSVVTATRNRPHLLEQALRSIKQQSFRDFEVVVVDDGSPPEIHESYGKIWNSLDERFVLHQASPPGGPGSDPGRGRNYGVRAARGELIAFLDHDDFWTRPDHLAVAVEAMQRTGAGYYFTHVRFEPEFPGLMWAVDPDTFAAAGSPAQDGSVFEAPLETFVAAMRHSHIHPSHSIVRRSVWEQAGGFIEGLKTADDVNFMLRVADLAPGILYRAEACVAIRMPEGKSYSLSSSASTQLLAEIHAAMDLRARSRRADVRACARSRQGWALRRLARHLQAENAAKSIAFAYEAFVIWPTPGAAWFLLRTLSRSLPVAAGSSDAGERVCEAPPEG